MLKTARVRKCELLYGRTCALADPDEFRKRDENACGNRKWRLFAATSGSREVFRNEKNAPAVKPAWLTLGD